MPQQPKVYAHLSLALSASGKLHLDFTDLPEAQLSQRAALLLQKKFEMGYAQGLLYLGVVNFSEGLPSSFAFWQKFSRLFVSRVCHHASLDIPVPTLEDLQDIIQQAPFMMGVEYLNGEVLMGLWQALRGSLGSEITHYGGSLQDYFNAHNATWNLVGRVCFHLAENKNIEDLPFAFLATYSDKLLSTSSVRHLPLGHALQEYAGEKNRASLLRLLLPVQKAAAQSPFINNLVESGDIFHPLAWHPGEAYQFLKESSVIESSGVIIRVPNWWNAKKPVRPKVEISLGKKEVSEVGFDALLDFDMHVALSDGEKLTGSELEDLLNSTGNFF